jgi:hypothetical protein
MLEQLQYPDAVPNAQGDALVPGDDLFGRRKRIAQDKDRQVEAFVGGRRGKDTLFLDWTAWGLCLSRQPWCRGHRVAADPYITQVVSRGSSSAA